jgi:hypothetical protein
MASYRRRRSESLLTFSLTMTTKESPVSRPLHPSDLRGWPLLIPFPTQRDHKDDEDGNKGNPADHCTGYGATAERALLVGVDP